MSGNFHPNSDIDLYIQRNLLNQHPKTESKLYAKADMKAHMERFKEKQLYTWIYKHNVRT